MWRLLAIMIHRRLNPPIIRKSPLASPRLEVIGCAEELDSNEGNEL